MKSGKVLASVLLTAVMVLAGCGTAPVEPSTPTATSQLTILPTVTIRVSTPPPSRTPVPTSTPDLSATATRIAEVATLQAIISAINPTTISTQVNGFPPFPSGCSSNYFIISANGEWIATSNCYLPDPALVVMNKSGTIRWEIHYRDYSYFYNDGNIAMQHWSKDNRYIYFSTAFFGDGGPCFYRVKFGGFGLFRLDVQTGAIVSMLPLRSDLQQYLWSFSPSGRRFVYFQSPNTLGIWDLYTGDVISTPLANDIEELGGFLWSDDGSFVVFTSLYKIDDRQKRYELNLTDATTGSTRTMMTSPITRCIRADSWTSRNVLNIEILDEPTWTYSQIVFDINSNQVIVTPTP